MAALLVRAKARRGDAHQLLPPVLQSMKESIPQPTSVWEGRVGRLAEGKRADNRLVCGTGSVDERREVETKPTENPEVSSITLL
jgi:hypothetical protein